METRCCSTCLTVKPIAEFHAGRCYYCKPCCRARDRGRRRGSGGNYSPAAQARKRRWQAAHPNPVKAAAYQQVRVAIMAGILVPPSLCQQCGGAAQMRDNRRAIQAHHYMGYNHPLSVQWLCPKCHRIADAAMNKKESR